MKSRWIRRNSPNTGGIPGFDIVPLNLDKWFSLAVFRADDLCGEFLNIYDALNGPLPPSLRSPTQTEFLADSPVLPSEKGVYPVPHTHYEEHKQLRWVLRMMGHGATENWTQIPPAPPVCAATEFVMDSTAKYAAQVPALKYKIVWSGTTPPSPLPVLQINERQELFSSPTFVIVENTNVASAITVNVRLGVGVSSTTKPLVLPAGAIQIWGIGGGKDPAVLDAAAEGSVDVTLFTCSGGDSYVHQVPSLCYNIQWSGTPAPPVTLQNAQDKPLFDSPHFVLIKNLNIVQAITVNVKVAGTVLTPISLLGGQTKLCLFSPASVFEAPLSDADKANGATLALGSYLSVWFDISTVGLLSAQAPAAAYTISPNVPAGDLFFQDSAEAPLFKAVFDSYRYVLNAFPSAIIYIQNNGMDRLVKWRTTTATPTLGTLPANAFAELRWSGRLSDAPLMKIPDMGMAGILATERSATKSVVTLTVPSENYTMPATNKALHYNITCALPSIPTVTLTLDPTTFAFSTSAVFDNTSATTMVLAMSGATGSPAQWGAGKSAIVNWGGVPPTGSGAHEIIVL